MSVSLHSASVTMFNEAGGAWCLMLEKADGSLTGDL